MITIADLKSKLQSSSMVYIVGKPKVGKTSLMYKLIDDSSVYIMNADEVTSHPKLINPVRHYVCAQHILFPRDFDTVFRFADQGYKTIYVNDLITSFESYVYSSELIDDLNKFKQIMLDNNIQCFIEHDLNKRGGLLGNDLIESFADAVIKVSDMANLRLTDCEIYNISLKTRDGYLQDESLIFNYLN